jgi:hypothetical protein
MQVDRVADGDRLPLGNDPRGAVDVTAHQVFEKVIAVEPAASLAKLWNALGSTETGFVGLYLLSASFL